MLFMADFTCTIRPVDDSILLAIFEKEAFFDICLAHMQSEKQSISVTYSLISDAVASLDEPASLCESDLSFSENNHLRNVCGVLNGQLQQMADYFGISIVHIGNSLRFKGTEKSVLIAQKLAKKLYQDSQKGLTLTPETIRLQLLNTTIPKQSSYESQNKPIQTYKKTITLCNQIQDNYVGDLRTKTVNFALGAAGTGKTYLAVAVAVEQLMHNSISKIILCRPAVESGEQLGFLPGNMQEKIDPYMRPLYDALHDFIPFQQLTKWFSDKTIEMIPLAYMRGRTLSNAYIILDEAQNTTPLQMKMFLTRLGHNSRVAINGDTKQTDLPKHISSGLIDATQRFKNSPYMAFHTFTAKHNMRHRLVASIIKAYENCESSRLNRPKSSPNPTHPET